MMIGIGITPFLCHQQNRLAAAAAAHVIPQTSTLIARWSASDITGVADGAGVSSWTSGVGGIATAPINSAKLPVYRAAALNGKPGVFFPAGNGYDSYGLAATIAGSPLAITFSDYEVMVVCSAVENIGGGVYAVASSANGLFGVRADFAYGSRTQAASPASMADLHCVFVSGGDFAIDGSIVSRDASGGWGNDFGIGSYSNGNNAFRGVIHDIVIWNKRLGLKDKIRATKWAFDKHGKAYPWAGLASYKVFLGDSLTYGFQSSGFAASYPFKAAAALSLTPGLYSSMGYVGYSWNELEPYAAAEVDGLSAITGIPTCLTIFEWYNAARENGNGDPHADARTFLQNRKASGIERIVFGTSTDANSSIIAPFKGARASYNAYWDTDANRTGLIDRYVRLHTDPNIGVAGCCPAENAGNAYFNPDAVHFTDQGYTTVAGLFSPQMSGI